MEEESEASCLAGRRNLGLNVRLVLIIFLFRLIQTTLRCIVCGYKGYMFRCESGSVVKVRPKY